MCAIQSMTSTLYACTENLLTSVTAFAAQHLSHRDKKTKIHPRTLINMLLYDIYYGTTMIVILEWLRSPSQQTRTKFTHINCTLPLLNNLKNHLKPLDLSRNNKSCVLSNAKTCWTIFYKGHVIILCSTNPGN